MLRKYDDDRGASLDIEEFAQLVEDVRAASGSSLQSRLNLRTHSAVLAALDAWWATATRYIDVRAHSPSRSLAPRPLSPPSLPPRLRIRSFLRFRAQPMKMRPKDVEPKLMHDEYVAIMKRVFKAMTKEWDDDDASETIEGEWESDRRGLDNIDEGLFMDGMFEVSSASAERPTHAPTTRPTPLRHHSRASYNHRARALSAHTRARTAGGHVGPGDRRQRVRRLPMDAPRPRDRQHHRLVQVHH